MTYLANRFCNMVIVVLLLIQPTRILDPIPGNHTNSDLHLGFYVITPLNDGSLAMGANVIGFDLCTFNLYDQSALDEIVSCLKRDLYRYEFIILKDQCMVNKHKIPPDILSDFASQFGIISDYGQKWAYHADPTPNISSFSNDESKGKVHVGAEGWHVDETAEVTLNSIVFQHIVAVPNKGYGATNVISSRILIGYIKRTNMTMYNLLNRLYVSKSNYKYVHPIIAMHPITGHEYMVLHTALRPNNKLLPQIHAVVDETMLFDFNTEFMRNATVLQDDYRRQHRNYEDKRVITWPPEKTKEFMQNMERFFENE